MLLNTPKLHNKCKPIDDLNSKLEWLAYGRTSILIILGDRPFSSLDLNVFLSRYDMR